MKRKKTNMNEKRDCF